jgi:short-subunit dehydrogenase
MISAQKYGPWALITGGSEGVGAAFAHHLAEDGFKVVLVARRQEPLTALAEELRVAGTEVRTLALDLTTPDVLPRIREVTDDVEIGLLICNAGAGGPPAYFLRSSLEEVMKAVELNPIAQTVLSHHFGKRMAERGRGGMILIGSMAANAGGATCVTYSAAKAYTQIFAEGLWSELQPLGIDVAYVVLGQTDTPARRRLAIIDSPGQGISSSDDIARLALTGIADGPVLVPEHLKEPFRTLCSLPRRQAAEAMRNLLTSVHAGLAR